jgi:hypothetical protein
MKRLFRDDIEPHDQTYRFIRDDPGGAEVKAFVEHLWSFFSPYADANFDTAIAREFHAKFWEMYLAFGLTNQGAKLERISSGSQGRRPRRGPDLLLSGLPHRVWIEATVPTDDSAVDRVPEERFGPHQEIPSDALILRYRTCLYDKFKKLCGYLKDGIVKESDADIIAISSRSLSYSLYEPSPPLIPRILQALFPFGPLVARLHRTAEGWGAPIDYSYRDQIEKKSGGPVSTNVFLDPTYDRISAVLFCASDVGHRPPSDAEVGLDFTLIHNPMAKNNIPYRWLKCGRECWVEDDHLVITSYVKETEPVGTLEDAIQKNNARRRVTREMLDQWRKDGA